MRRTVLSLSIFAFGGLAATAPGCDPGIIPIGHDDADGGGPGSDSGGAACGSSTCTQGELCCPGTDMYCTPTCMRVTSCPVLGRACFVRDAGGSTDSGSTSDAEPTDAPPPADAEPIDAQPGNLRWFMTCGDPVCQAPGSDAGLTETDGGPCPVIGSGCSTAGEMCGTPNPAVACGATEVCAAKDPTARLGGCPISSRKFKDGIDYLDPAQLEQLHDETLRIRLATYSYKAAYADPTPRRLGFIIEDNPASPAVDRAHDSIEIYGYLSMVVATMQVQEREIASLKQELAERGPACGR
jgi:hypothetical protein